MSRTIHLPPVVHMVADLDDLDVAVPAVAARRRHSLVGRLKAALHRLSITRRTVSYATMTALLAFLIACSDSNDPVTPPRAVATVSVSPSAASLGVGETVHLGATMKDASGNVLTGRAIRWSTNSTAIATVSSSGIVTAVAEGMAIISAESEGKVGQAQVTVARVPVARVAITPTTVVLEIGRTRQLTAVAFDANDNVLAGRTVQWSASPAAVLSVSVTGLIEALSHGYGDVTATVDGKSSTIGVTVTEPEPVGEYRLVRNAVARRSVGHSVRR